MQQSTDLVFSEMMNLTCPSYLPDETSDYGSRETSAEETAEEYSGFSMNSEGSLGKIHYY